MTTMKVIGIAAAVLLATGAIGGGVWWWYRRKKNSEDAADGPRPVSPSKPPRAETHQPQGTMMKAGEVPSVLQKILDEKYSGMWPPTDEVIDSLEPDDVVVFAVESEPVGNYTSTRQELISAKVLSVEKTHVRGRVRAPVAYAEHHGSHAGHGFRVGDLVEVPRESILLAAKNAEPEKTGYDGKGKAEQTFEPSSLGSNTAYKVRPATPYDLVLPYRTDELEWHVDRDMVNMIRIGASGLLEQIMFSEDSMRGPVTVRALDNDPKEGKVFVARWDFTIEP